MGEVVGFDPDIPVESAWTPPSCWYTDPAFLEREREHVFGASWQAVGRLDQLAAPGSYFACDVAGEPVVVVRDEEGSVRALSNVCRHHAACVAQGEGRAQELVCPYHGWSYRLDGRLKSAPRLGAARDFRREDFCLPAFPTAVWGPLVFVHLGTPRRPLEQLLAPLELPRLEELRFVARREYTLECNWKVYVDNYLDGGYHVSHLHRDLAANLDLSGYRTELFEELSVQACSGGEDDRVGREARYAFFYPNFMLNRYGPWLDTNLVLPLGTDRCRTIFDYYLEPERADDAEFVRTSLAASDQVQQEDVGICESVQRGLRSRFYDRGRYAPQIEHADHLFHRLLARDLSSPAPRQPAETARRA